MIYLSITAKKQITEKFSLVKLLAFSLFVKTVQQNKSQIPYVCWGQFPLDTRYHIHYKPIHNGEFYHLNFTRVARRVKINEIKLTIILFAYVVFGFTAQIITTFCYLILSKLLINFHARFRYQLLIA